jgi:hypothetical protein
MTRKSILMLAAIIAGELVVVAAVHAESLGGHRDQHLSEAAQACLVVIRQDQRRGLDKIFREQKSVFIADDKAWSAAKHDVSLAILTKSDMTTPENNLFAAKTKVQHDEDAMAAKICGLLDKKQLSAAEDLYKNLTALRQSSDEEAGNYFKAARSAAGDPASQNAVGDGPQNAD